MKPFLSLSLFYTYILFCNDSSYYTGITNNLARRIEEHKKGQSKSTRRKRPIRLIWVNAFKTRSEARSKEVYIKNRGAKRFLLHKQFSP